MRQSLQTLFIFYAFHLILIGCASQSQPTGGPKDETPPRLVRSSPESESLNFDGTELALEFDEFIKLDDINNQLIITPRLDIEYEVKAVKNLVTVKLDGALDDSTTYTFNFRKGIKDVTESNEARNMVLAFSTGSFLDSLSLSGNVTDLLKDEPAVDYTVAIFDAADSSDIFESSPKYSTQTDEKGAFKFENIKAATYKVYAFKDVNSNGTAQSNSEPYGYSLDEIALDSNTVASKLATQFLDIRDWQQISSRQNGRYYELKYNKYIVDYSLISLGDSSQLISVLRDKRRTIKLFNTFPIEDSLQVQVSVTDSIGTSKIDTVSIFYEPTERSPEEFTTSPSAAIFQTNNNTLSFKASFNKPASINNLDSIYIRQDSVTIFTADTTATLLWSENNTRLEFEVLVPQEIPVTGNQLTLAPTAFTSIENDTSSVQSTAISTIKPDDLGLIKVELSTAKQSFTTQLLNNSFQVVEEFVNDKSLEFQVPPGDYYLRVLVDDNNNGRWDPGSILSNSPPEQVVYFIDEETSTKLFTVRANWELGPYLISF